jgi:outer membrane protein assembly factor BamA
MILLLCLLFLTAAAARAAPAPEPFLPVGSTVKQVEIENRSRVGEAEIRRLFLLDVGDRYSPEAVQRSLTLLGQKVEIRNVLVTGEPYEGGLALHLSIVPEPLIRSIRFRGNRALSDARLSSRLTVKVDRPARDAILERDARSIRELYDEEGYPSAQVTYTRETDESGQWLQLVFQIEENAPRRIQRIEVEGEIPMEHERMVALLGGYSVRGRGRVGGEPPSGGRPVALRRARGPEVGPTGCRPDA